jgi:hypothetical protein
MRVVANGRNSKKQTKTPTTNPRRDSQTKKRTKPSTLSEKRFPAREAKTLNETDMGTSMYQFGSLGESIGAATCEPNGARNVWLA